MTCKRILLIISLWLVFGGYVYAQQLDSGTISAGGALQLQGGGVSLQDIKGQSAAGVVTNGTITVEVGGLYGELTEEAAIPSQPDNGLIHNTMIERVADAAGADIRVKFRSQSSVANANIFRLSGANAEFSTSGAWVLIAQNVAITNPGSDTDTVWLESSLSQNKITVGDGINAYYRVVPSTVLNTADLFGSSNNVPYNEKTIGKVDLDLKKGFNCVSVPLVQQFGNDVGHVIGQQLTAVPPTSPTDNVYNYYFSGGNLQSDKASLIDDGHRIDWKYTTLFQMSTYKGFWVEIVNSPKLISIVGLVPTTNDLQAGLMLYPLYNIIGTPCPLSKPILSSGFTQAFSGTPTDPGDEILNYYFDANNQLMTRKASFINNDWKFTAPFDLKMSNGFWYQRKSSQPAYNWVFSP